MCFSIGTGLAGASNVLKNDGKGSALLVLVFDIAKGSLAVIVSAMMGVEGLLILIPASLAVFGHWNSLFTRFRGGDGMAIGGGIALALFGTTGLAAFFVGGLVGLVAQKLPFSSLFSIITGYLSLLFITIFVVVIIDVVASYFILKRKVRTLKSSIADNIRPP